MNRFEHEATKLLSLAAVGLLCSVGTLLLLMFSPLLIPCLCVGWIVTKLGFGPLSDSEHNDDDVSDPGRQW